MTDRESERYSRHIMLPEIGVEGQQKLKNSKVLVVGAGGLGCPVLQYMAAAGVGVLGIVDHDKVEESNLQRQILYSVDDIGKSKAIQAGLKLAALNPYIEINTCKTRLNRDNVLDLVAAYDIIVDGTDNFPTRYLLNDACVIEGKPLVSGSIFKFDGQLSVFNYNGGPTYRCLYPEPPAPEESPNCGETGVMGVLPGIMGTLQANEVIKMITGIGHVLSGKLLSFDALSMTFSTFSFRAVEANRHIAALEPDYEDFCGITLDYNEITAEELREKLSSGENFQLIDVRSKAEYESFNIGGTLLPLDQLQNNAGIVDENKSVVLICQSGVRSAKAIRVLRNLGIKAGLYNLKGGLNHFLANAGKEAF